MKKTLLAISLAVITSAVFCGMSDAATVTYTKPSLKVNTTQEESILSKKMKEIEQKQAEAKAKSEANKKAAQEKQAQREKELKAKQDAAKADIEKAKADLKSKENAMKKDIEKAKADSKAKQEANKAAAKARQKQRAEAMDNFKNSFKF